MLASKPLGLKGATNPVAAGGGADPEVLANARSNAPLTVRTLDRIVALADYEDFARAFAGVGKAQAVDLWSGETHLVHVTVAGADGDPIDESSDLFTNLVGGINNVRDPAQIVRVDSFQRLLFNLQAKVAVDSPRYIKANVYASISDALQRAFAFPKRAFGQIVTSAEVITIIQEIDGVIAVDLDYLYLSSANADFNTLLPAQIARVEDNGLIQLAQLLLINPIGVTLEEMKP
jgi:predicted phage baseplate assembly protein